MPFQKIKEISIRNLQLWSENPRDPFVGEKSNLDIIKYAVENWKLKRFAQEMGETFDSSELPTVVQHENKNVVYDGNRRVILAMIYHGIYKSCSKYKFYVPEFPYKMPCNVCDQQTAFKNIYRKHSDTGSWSQLNRDIFVYKHLNEPKTPLLLIDELTGLVSKSKWLDRRFIGEEVFKEGILKDIGIEIDEGKIDSQHNLQDLVAIINRIEKLHRAGILSTRKNRSETKILSKLKAISKDILQKNGKKEYKRLIPLPNSEIKQEEAPVRLSEEPKKTGRTKKERKTLFGGNLALRKGIVNDLYRDLDDTYNFYLFREKSLSENYPAIIRMGLRLLSETAAKSNDLKMDQYIRNNYKIAKKRLSQDEKTYISSQAVNESNIVKLLQIGAHNYHGCSNIEQAKAISMIIGKMLAITEGKNVT